MLRSTPCFPPTGIRSTKGIRTRILGEAPNSSLLFLINTLQRTSIELIRPDGSSTTVASFKSYMDLICADISPDNEYIHYTERVVNTSGISYQSCICHLHTVSRSKLFLAQDLISAIFVPCKQRDSCRFLHVVGGRLSYVRGNRTNQIILTEQIRAGPRVHNLLSWQYNRSSQLLSFFYYFEGKLYLSEYLVSEVGIMPKPCIEFAFFPASELPPSLLVSPIEGTHLPLFNFSKTRTFVFHFSELICVVQQLFERTESVTIQISFCPNGFSKKIDALITTIDSPISCFQFDVYVFVFIPDHFSVVVDLSKSPPLFLSVTPDCISPKGISHRTLPFGSNYLVDLENGHIFTIEMIFDRIASQKLSECRHWSLLTSLLARTLKSDMIAHFFQLLIPRNSIFDAWNAITEFFTFLIAVREFQADPMADLDYRRDGLALGITQILDDFERIFPASGSVSRLASFWAFVQTALKTVNFEQSCQKAIQIMKTENEIVSRVHNAIEDWLEEFHPPENAKFTLFTMVDLQTHKNRLPDVPRLREKLDAIPADARIPSLIATLNGLRRHRHTVPDDPCEDLVSIMDSNDDGDLEI
jgi:hypothetical protein